MAGKNDSPRAFESSRQHRNVVLNFNKRADMEFGPYGRGFLEAARKLAEPLLQLGVHSDLEGPPVVFMYRHALELQLKAVLLAGNQLMAFDGEDLQDKALWELLKGHRLSVLLPRLKRIFSYMDWKDPIDCGPIRRFSDIESVIKDIERVDPHSFAFRYPTNTKGQQSVTPHFSFSIPSFVNAVDPLIELLSGSVYAVEHAWDNACEAHSYYEYDREPEHESDYEYEHD